jgi:sec-independent protein translocase protein TatC
MVAAGLVFLLPLLLLLLIGTGLVSTRTLSRLRPWVIMAIALAAALLTPPDVVSQILLGVPLYLLFEGSLLLGKFLEK